MKNVERFVNSELRFRLRFNVPDSVSAIQVNDDGITESLQPISIPISSLSRNTLEEMLSIFSNEVLSRARK